MLLGKRKKGNHLEEIEVDRRIVTNRLFKFEWQEVKSTGLSQDGVKFWAFVIMELNIWFHKWG
jgi:hypothetical protein